MLKEENIPKILHYPQFITRAGTSYVHFTIYERNNRDVPVGMVVNPEANDPIREIFIYMPERAAIPSTTAWDTENLGMVLGQALPRMRDDGFMKGIANTLKEAGAAMGNTAMNYAYFNSMAHAAQLAGLNLTSGVAMGVLGQKIPNPHVTLLFRGVNLRTFEFSFKLYPHDIKERDAIQHIIACFRAYALPEANERDFFLGYPPFFNIQYYYNKNESEYLNRFKKCALVSVDTDYTLSGMWSLTRDGFPTEINLTLRFTEEELVLRDDVLNKGY
jgi:hypothetical protein